MAPWRERTVMANDENQDTVASLCQTKPLSLRACFIHLDDINLDVKRSILHRLCMPVRFEPFSQFRGSDKHHALFASCFTNRPWDLTTTRCSRKKVAAEGYTTAHKAPSLGTEEGGLETNRKPVLPYD